LRRELLHRTARGSRQRVRIVQRLSEYRLGLFAGGGEHRLRLFARGRDDLLGFRLGLRDIFVRRDHSTTQRALEGATPQRSRGRGIRGGLQSTELAVELVDPHTELGHRGDGGLATGSRGPHLFEGFTHEDDNNPSGRAIRILLIVIATVIAFNQTLRSSLRVLSVDSPLAYTGLVPGVALLVALTRPPSTTRSHPTRAYQTRRDTRLGIACCAFAVAVSIAGTTGIGSAAWAWRVDVPAMAMFVAGGILVLFGRDELRRQRATVVILALAWPLPWALLFLRVLTPFTALTVAVVRGGLGVTHWAKRAGGSSTRFLMSGSSPYVIDVAPACSGIDGVVGFVLVSVAFGALIVGSRVRKALWLGAAVVLLWVLNAIRVLAIFGVAHEWGRRIAIDWLHPYAGIVMFNIALITMLALLGRFGLHIRSTDTPSSVGHPGRLGVVVCIIVAALALAGAAGNLRLDRFDLGAHESPTTTRPFEDVATSVLGADHVRSVGERRDASAFFADNASWLRYDLVVSGHTVRADVIRTDSESALATFGTAAFMRSPATAITRVEAVAIGTLRAQVWHFANGTADVVWLARVKSASAASTEQVVLSGADRAALLRLAGVLAGVR
jgi:exosortase/archaeosortase family protein